MSFSAGVFTINTAGEPVVTGTTISSTAFNLLTADLATGLSTCILKDGTQTTTAPIPFSGSSNSSAAAGTCLVRGGQIGFPSTQVVSTDTNTLDDYDEHDGAAGSCTNNTANVGWTVIKVGRVVTLKLPVTIGTTSVAASFNYATLLPAKYRPVQATIFAVPITENSVRLTAVGCVYLDTNGNIFVYKSLDLTATYSNTANSGLNEAINLTWQVAA